MMKEINTLDKLVKMLVSVEDSGGINTPYGDGFSDGKYELAQEILSFIEEEYGVLIDDDKEREGQLQK